MFGITKIRNYWILCLCFAFCHGDMIRVTDTKCVTVDETFVNITKCFTKHLSNTVSETTANTTLFQVVTAAAIKLQFRKKSNGNYNPFFRSDQLFDGCKFITNRAVSPIASYIYSAIEDFTNMNHTCPYKGYVLVDRFRVDMKKLKWLPIPGGEYFINSHWMLNGLKRFEWGVYFTITE